MLAEGVDLNPVFEHKRDWWWKVIGRRILQLMHLKPSHVVLPAVIHIKREQVGEREIWVRRKEWTPTYTYTCSPEKSPSKFIHAEVAMTQVLTFAVASTGEIVVCTNEEMWIWYFPA